VVNIVGAVPIDKIANLEGQFIHDGKHGHTNKKDSAKKGKDKESDDEKK
jgi:hypothetical protein